VAAHPPGRVAHERARARRVARIATLVAALACASAIVPAAVGIERERLTLAFLGAACAAAWTRADGSALKWLAALACASALALALFDLLLSALPVPPQVIWNVHLWTLVVPAACAAFAAVRIAPLERTRAPGSDAQPPAVRALSAAAIAGAVAVVFGFAWINVEITCAFAADGRAGLGATDEQGRGLALSIAWAVYALALLALGVWRGSSGPRWASLVLFLVTIAKVFLIDLGHLEGLQRAASMLGLALSLLVVSLVYQRFVFRSARGAAPDPVAG
jgi:uncharacterized membrane protein